MEDGVLTFSTMTETTPPSTGYLSVTNIGDEPFVVTPRITGSTVFTVANPQPVTLEPGGPSHVFDLVFDPELTGWNEATLGFVDDACAAVTLRGYSVVVSGANMWSYSSPGIYLSVRTSVLSNSIRCSSVLQVVHIIAPSSSLTSSPHCSQ